jgi:homocysteine S-methyltransferase
MPKIEDSELLLTTPGVETHLAFTQGFDLREFCAFEVFESEEELTRLTRGLLGPTLAVAAEHDLDLLVDALVWRAQPDYLERLGYQSSDVSRVNTTAVMRTRALVRGWQNNQRTTNTVFINGDLGPRGDGYRLEGPSSVDEARSYHQPQVDALADAGVDALSCLTMTGATETIGLVQAIQSTALPCIVSPTVETDGLTPEGLELGDYIDQVEQATGGYPLFYMVNCAHPLHLEPALRRAQSRGEGWLRRFKGFRSNASHKSHEELDRSTELDRGHPEALAAQIAHLQADFGLRLVGGCCGTDSEHISKLAESIRRTDGQEAVRVAR